MSDLEKLALTINEKSDESLETTRRMREMCAEAKVGYIYNNYTLFQVLTL